MISKYEFGNTVITDCVVEKLEASSGDIKFGFVEHKEPFCWTYKMDDKTKIFGLGEAVRGMDKRGFVYESWCSDVPGQHEGTKSMYGAHNFLIFKEKVENFTFGIFFDTASKVIFDLGFEKTNIVNVSVADTGVNVYIITPENNRGKESALVNITRQFRRIIGQSYIPPFWGFGFQQSRWGYKTEADVKEVLKNHIENKLPIDSICLDIDYMDSYKDFSIDENKFKNLGALSKELLNDGVRLIPIIDAGVKLEDGYSVYEEGRENNYFCKKLDEKTDYVAGVWPGRSCFPDFLRSDVREWFGKKYQKLTDNGIEGFWNDMNEPAMFYSDESLAEALEQFETFKGQNLDIQSFFEFTKVSGSTFNQMKDYKRFCNKVTFANGEEKYIRHDKIHNLFGGKMTQAASEGLDKLLPDHRTLLYSRASCIGAHRYGGIWTGDNNARWNHLEQEIKMLPGLNMCGFLYSGADIGGFSELAGEDLMIRWMGFGVFTPLMRNHAAWDAREKELYKFEKVDVFRSILQLRYSLLPYIYSEFVKASVKNEMFIRPLGFDFEEDERAMEIQDQLMIGDGIMLAPVYKQNEYGRTVYFPENMTKVVWKNGKFECSKVRKGDLYVKMPLDSVVFFVRNKKAVPLFEPCNNSSSVKTDSYKLAGNGKSYELYEDDGFTKDIHLEGRIRNLSRR